MAYDFTRRHFFFGSLLAGAIPSGGFGSTASLGRLGYKSPNEKLNIAAIGAGGQAASDLTNCASENIVALCDVDELQAARKFSQYEKVPKYKDFRKMLDKEKGIDAVIVTIPDFMHATAATWCIERGKHVWVQKPLTRTIWEARKLMEAANKYKVATQMGNQGYSCEGTRQVAEIIWSGEIGNVTEVHAWTDRPIWPQGLTRIPAPAPVPGTLDWDLWLGGAAPRPYTDGGAGYPNEYGFFYQPFNWRGFYDFGCGAIGDMACHILGASNLALKLGSPTSVECIHKEGASDFMFPKKSTIRFDFPARGNMPPVKLFWYDGLTANPEIPGVPKGEYLGDLPTSGARRGGRGAGQAAGRGSATPPPAPSGFIGRVFNFADFDLVRKDPNANIPKPDGSL
ncbi:MAG: Gfo/Idh/MocA family oxidoreductase, partial [Bryobacteraceae bacterium]